MKKLYSFIAITIGLFLMSGTSNAQSFIRNYVPSSGTSTLNIYTSVLPTSTGNYLACGQMKETGGATADMLMTLFNQNGDEIWSRKLGDVSEPEASFSAVEIGGNYYVIGWTNNSGANYNELLIIALDPSGNMLAGWPRQYQSSGSTSHKYCYRLIQMGNKIVVSGHTTSGGFDNLLFAVDMSGNIVWDHTYNIVGTDKGGYELVHLQNGNLLTAGHIYNGSFDAQIMITDSTGIFVDLFRYDCSGQDIYPPQIIDLGPVNGIIAIGNYSTTTNRDIYAMKIDYNGNISWATRYGINSQDDYASEAVLLDDGTIGIAGYTENPNSSNNSSCALFMRINTSGSIVSQSGYQPSNTANESYKFYGVAKNAAGDIVLVGSGVSPNSGSDGMILTVMDKNGISELGCGQVQTTIGTLSISITKTAPSVTTGVGFGIGASVSTVSSELITEDDACGSFIGIEENNSQAPLLVYPNPAADIIQINIPYPSANGSFELLNMEGKVLRNGQVAADIFSMDVSDLSSGVYVIKLYINNVVLHSKLIKN
jgi:hypothetical protein